MCRAHVVHYQLKVKVTVKGKKFNKLILDIMSCPLYNSFTNGRISFKLEWHIHLNYGMCKAHVFSTTHLTLASALLCTMVGSSCSWNKWNKILFLKQQLNMGRGNFSGSVAGLATNNILFLAFRVVWINEFLVSDPESCKPLLKIFPSHACSLFVVFFYKIVFMIVLVSNVDTIKSIFCTLFYFISSGFYCNE